MSEPISTAMCFLQIEVKSYGMLHHPVFMLHPLCIFNQEKKPSVWETKCALMSLKIIKLLKITLRHKQRCYIIVESSECPFDIQR